MPTSLPNHEPSLAGKVCKRCGEQQSELLVRGDSLCRDCFLKYVSTKVIKRMDNFRVRNAVAGEPRRLLVPVSMGVSSVCLVHLLDQMQDSQLVRMNRAGFELHVLHVEESPEAGPGHESRARFARLQERYPRHNYHWTQAPTTPETPAETTAYETITLQKSLASASSQADILLVSRTATIVRLAKQHACECVLWGDTTTQLAATILAETAKGRGFSLPWRAADGPSPYGIDFMYPMREMLKKELRVYATMVSPSLADVVHEPEDRNVPVSTKNNTIDGLMREYFEGVERNFPSIVANVVRTGAKLQAPASQAGTRNCEVCRMPVADGTFGLLGWAGDQQASNDHDSIRLPGDRCYGCTRSLLGSVGYD